MSACRSFGCDRAQFVRYLPERGNAIRSPRTGGRDGLSPRCCGRCLRVSSKPIWQCSVLCLFRSFAAVAAAAARARSGATNNRSFAVALQVSTSVKRIQPSDRHPTTSLRNWRRNGTHVTRTGAPGHWPGAAARQTDGRSDAARTFVGPRMRRRWPRSHAATVNGKRPTNRMRSLWNAATDASASHVVSCGNCGRRRRGGGTSRHRAASGNWSASTAAA